MIRRGPTATLVAAVALTAVVCSEPANAAAGQAVAFQGDVAHSGFVSEPGLNPPLRRRWQHRFPGQVSYPVLGGGKVFVTAWDGPRNGYPHHALLVALSAASGKPRWQRDLGDTFGAVPAYDDGRVYVSSGPGGIAEPQLAAFSATDGSLLWSHRFLTGGGSPPVAQGGVAYASDGDGFGAYRGSDGAQLWRVVADDANELGGGGAALSADAVYPPARCPLALRRSDGGVIWQRPDACRDHVSTPALAGGRLYLRNDFAAAAGSVFDAGTGALVRRFRADYAPAFTSNGLGFFPDEQHPGTDFQAGHTLIARSLANGRKRWAFRGDGYLDSAPLVVNRTAYVGSGSGRIYGLSLRSGRPTWRVDLGDPVPGPQEPGQILSGLAAGNGMLLVPALGRLVAYRGRGS
jgi:outer membrane protein assembly factor BamB